MPFFVDESGFFSDEKKIVTIKHLLKFEFRGFNLHFDNLLSDRNDIESPREIHLRINAYEEIANFAPNSSIK